MNSSERIVYNSIILYAKLVITICVNLIATRLILNAMGVEDYGVVNLISGIVSMLTFVQNSMAISTQRYMSVNMGKHDIPLQRKIFNNGLALHILLSIFLLIILQSFVSLVFNSDIQIPANRYSASMILYQLTCVGTILVVIGVPFDATLSAHENMLLVSFASILESLIRLSGAIWLLSYKDDKLVFYGVLIVAIRLASLLFKAIYCKKKYAEVQFFKSDISRKLMKKMFSFSFWNMFGAFAMAARSQGVAVVLNIFNGVAVNTAYGIGSQLSGQLANFSGTISRSMSPQIMQREGSGNRNAMISLALKQCKYTSLFMFMFALPLYTEMPYILRLWLKTVPDYSVVFCRIFLLLALAKQMSSGLMTAMQAKGQIAAYQTIMSVLLLLSIPISYYIQKKGYSPSMVLWAMFLIEIACLIVRVIMARKLVEINSLYFIKHVVLKLMFAFIPTTSVVILLKLLVFSFYPPSVQLVVILIITISLMSFFSFLSFDISEKNLVKSILYKMRHRIV